MTIHRHHLKTAELTLLTADSCWSGAAVSKRSDLFVHSEGLQPCDGSAQDEGMDIMSTWRTRRQTGSIAAIRVGVGHRINILSQNYSAVVKQFS